MTVCLTSNYGQAQVRLGWATKNIHNLLPRTYTMREANLSETLHRYTVRTVNRVQRMNMTQKPEVVHATHV